MSHHFISASAGTGKTFALTTRVIRLLLLGAPPRSILALTFSRAAAGEIFNKLVARLAEAATDNARAATLSAQILDKLPPDEQAAIRSHHATRSGNLPPAAFAALLRSLVATQHQSNIGTIDSFMWRVARMFPLELGLGSEPAMTDEPTAARAKIATAKSLLFLGAANSAAHEFFDAFFAATHGKEGKTFVEKLSTFVNAWHDRWLDFHPGDPKTGWGVPETLWGPTGCPFQKRGDLAALAERFRAEIANNLPPSNLTPGRQGEVQSALGKVADFAADFNGTVSGAPGFLEKLLLLWDRPARALGPLTYHKKEVPFSRAQSRLASDLLETLVASALDLRCKHTRGIGNLMRGFEAAYEKNFRSAGGFVFADIPRLVARLGDVNFALLAFRLDAQIRHWLLDEFQDTSRAQWRVIGPLVREALADSDTGATPDDLPRSVFTVGDAKQSIYGWRGGDVAIFLKEKSRPEYTCEPLYQSYRYGAVIAEAVNTVFAPAALTAFLGDSAATRAWADVWHDHTSAGENTADHGQVAVKTVSRSHGATHPNADDFADSILAELQETRPLEKGLETAILVRDGATGKILSERLRAAGIHAVWEGESAISDTPVVTALLNLVLLSAHPGDTLAARHIAASPLAGLFNAPPAALSQRLARQISRLGLARALAEIVRPLKDALPPENAAFVRSRLDDLLLAAARYEAAARPDNRADDFVDFVNAAKRRDFADKSAVKILTIHRSKGLGFDYVILPLHETKGMDSPQSLHEAPLVGKTNNAPWLLENPGELISQNDRTLADAAERARQKAIFETLCVYYVAMTRAKKLLSIHTREVSEGSNTRYFSALVAQQLESLPGKLDLAGQPADGQPAARQPADDAAPIALPAAPNSVTPSSASRRHDRLFPEKQQPAAEQAADRGTRLHDALAKIEWLPAPGQPADIPAADINLSAPSPFRDALANRPGDLAALWREKSFEIFLPPSPGNPGGEWLSGRFDRVVLTGPATSRRARILDYKTNTPLPGESPGGFADRMAETYAPQMALYRRALARLAGIPEPNITATLLLSATLAAREV
ncbi:MAG: UvrD-helicase domain-containing protein [Opitutaceae bacterium]|jgi:ATP-dependent exoDNAse (exonuclease V) beta subunit|nr:UvrD-helicase domain-containing protein [Opitutaceae bacterium]